MTTANDRDEAAKNGGEDAYEAPAAVELDAADGAAAVSALASTM